MKKFLLIALILSCSCSCTKIGLFGNGQSPIPQADKSSVHSAVAYTPMVSSGLSHSCALNSLGEVFCWGRNNVGQLGYDDSSNRGDASGEMTALIAVNLSEKVKKIVTGYNHTWALFENDFVKCWGYAGYGSLGSDDTSDRGGGAGSMSTLVTFGFEP